MASPRLSIESIVQNRGDPINVSTVQNVGACSNRSAITVTDTPTPILIGAGKRTLEIVVVGANDVYFGGATVSSTNGLPIYSTAGNVWSNVKDDFVIYLVCAPGLTSEVRIAEYT